MTVAAETEQVLLHILQIDTMIHCAINLFPRTAAPMTISAKCLLICEDESAAWLCADDREASASRENL